MCIKHEIPLCCRAILHTKNFYHRMQANSNKRFGEPPTFRGCPETGMKILHRTGEGCSDKRDRSYGSQSSGKFAGARTFQGSLGPTKGTLVIPYRVWLKGSASLAA